MINFLRIIGNIKLGDYLHSNGTIDNIPSNDIIGVCVIPSNSLPDRYARFIYLGDISYYTWGRNIRLKSEYKRNLPGKGKNEIFNWGFVNREKGDRLLINPYLSNGSFNPEFLRDLPEGNAFQDYKGYENIKLYKEKYGGDKEFSNAFTEVIKRSPSYKKDNWYLPAIGELAFIPPRFWFIREKMKKAIEAGSPGVALPANRIWSSSERDSNRAWYISTGYSYVSNDGKVYKNYILSFLSL